jgi:prepilin-type N-terminal cleavage/methylation domain-containing protein
MARQWLRRADGRRGGFTTIELLIVVVVLGILAGFAVPSILTTVANDRVRRAQYATASYIELAFQYAARTRKPLTITLNTTTQVLAITDRSSGTLYRQIDLSRGGDWSLTAVSMTPTAGITIFPTGLASSAMTITLTNNSFSKNITSTIAGQVSKP